MTALKYMTKWFAFCLFALVAICGCKHNTATTSTDDDDDEVIHTKMQYFDFDKIDNLLAFFDSISNVHGIPIRDLGGEEHAERDVFDCIKRIEEYRNGKYKFYPDSIVKGCLNMLGLECAFINNHGPGIDMTYAEWFLMLVAFYSPDITCLVHMQTPNHQAGILNFGSSYNYNPWWSYVFLKRSKGFEVRRIREDETKIDKIFQLEDAENRLYYLCSNNTSEADFLQVLFWVKNENDIVLVAQHEGLSNKANYEEIYFNPEVKAWYYCNKDKISGKLIPISSTPTLMLRLDGEKSCFTQE